MKALHMSGAGNDFVVIDARGKTLDLKKLAIKLCALTGADGFMAIDCSAVADIRMHFYNPDGLRGEMCGNGARCVCKFAYDLGLAGPTVTIETDAGLICGWRLSDTQYRIQLNNPSLLDLHRKGDTAYVELGNPGIPHSVTQLPTLDFAQKEALLPLAKQLRFESVFPKGVNVNFYTWLGDARVRLLTYERGVEDYTLACGTGSASVAAVLWHQGKLPGGVLEIENQGGTLTVTVIVENGGIERLFLEGPAEVLEELDI